VICPSGKSLLVFGNHVKPQNKKYFAFPEGRNRAHLLPSRPGTRGASRSSLARDGERWTQRHRRRTVLKRTAKTCGPDAPVLASSWRSVPPMTVARKPVHRGERVISRKAIAQGMSDCLRCPVCSCAHFLCTLRMRPRVQRASGIPCALFISEGERFRQDSGISCRENGDTCLAHRHCERSEAIHASA
jgi:hypothetical protein